MAHSTTDQTMPWATATRLRAAILTVAPLAMLAAYLYHPHLMLLPDATAVAHAVQADTTRWAIAHLGIAVGSGLMILAFVALRNVLWDAGERLWSARALPFAVMAATLYAFLPGTEFTVLAAAQTGADIVAAQHAIDPWFVPVMMTSALLHFTGCLLFARGIARSRAFSASQTRFVVGALVILGASRFAPLAPVQFYLQGLAGLAALWPVAYQLWSLTARNPAGERSAMPAV